MTMKILVVDDSASDRLLIQKILSDYTILTAADGVQAMAQLDKHADIDLVVLDLKMPEMDGFAVLEALKAESRYAAIRVIILTNIDEVDSEIRGLKMGAADYIRKPIHMESLRVRVQIQLDILRMQQLLRHKTNDQIQVFQTIFDEAPIGIAMSYGAEPAESEAAYNTQINSMYEKITGRSKEELIRLGWAAITHPDDLTDDLKNYKQDRSGESLTYAMDKRYIKPDGSIVWVHMIVAPLTISDSSPYKHITLIQDITRRKEMEQALRESERSKSVLLSHLPGLAYRCRYDRDWTMEYVSAGCLKLTGYPEESLIHNRDLTFNDLIAPEYREVIWDQWKQMLAKNRSFEYEYEIITASGDRKWVLELGQGINGASGEIEALEGIILDISDRKKIEDMLRFSNEHDRWTGLYNRNYLENLLAEDLNVPLLKQRALVGINLSTVQALSRNYGFHYTQEVIKHVVDNLKRLCTEKRQFFHTYENRFVFYLQDYADRNELDQFCRILTEKLRLLLASERVGGGIGVVEINQNNQQSSDQLFKNLLIASEIALEEDDKDFNVCVYDAAIEAQIIYEHEIEHELILITTAADDGSLLLQYQPIMDLRSEKICGFEALARLNSQTVGHVPPLSFIPLAEETKLIIPIGRKIIIQALRFLKKLQAQGGRSLHISINISVIQLLNRDFFQDLLEITKTMQIDPASISLEITESVFASDFDIVNRVLGLLKDAGFQIAIDDFGTGYSSLSRERDLNVSCLKIDRSFISKLMDISPEKAITGDIISMAHKLGHCVVAEGVEYEQQKKYLQSSGCDRIQGYLISKPLDEADAIDFLKNMNQLQ